MDENKKTQFVCNKFEMKIEELMTKNPNFKIKDYVGWTIMLTYK